MTTNSNDKIISKIQGRKIKKSLFQYLEKKSLKKIIAWTVFTCKNDEIICYDGNVYNCKGGTNKESEC